MMLLVLCLGMSCLLLHVSSLVVHSVMDIGLGRQSFAAALYVIGIW